MIDPKKARRIPKDADLSRIHPDLRDKAVPCSLLTAHPDNPRVHPEANKRAIAGSLKRFQQRNLIVVNRTDAGLRIEAHHEVFRQMLELGSEYVAVAIMEDDPITEMGFLLADNRTGDLSEDDPEKLSPILRQLIDAGEEVEEIGWDEQAVKALLTEPEKPTGDDWEKALGDLPDGDKPPFQQMTFTLHDSQVEQVKAALARAKGLGDFSGPNENSNGNALARVCEAFLGEV